MHDVSNKERRLFLLSLQLLKSMKQALVKQTTDAVKQIGKARPPSSEQQQQQQQAGGPNLMTGQAGAEGDDPQTGGSNEPWGPAHQVHGPAGVSLGYGTMCYHCMCTGTTAMISGTGACSVLDELDLV